MDKKHYCDIYILDNPKEELPKLFHDWKYTKPFYLPMTDVIVAASRENVSMVNGSGNLSGIAVKSGDTVTSLADFDDIGVKKGETGVLMYLPEDLDINDENGKRELNDTPLYVEFGNYEQVPYRREQFVPAGELTLGDLKNMGRDYNSILFSTTNLKPGEPSSLGIEDLKEVGLKTRNLVIAGTLEDLKVLFNQQRHDNLDFNELSSCLNYYTGLMALNNGSTWEVQEKKVPEISKDPNAYREPDEWDISMGMPFPVWNR